MTTVDFKYDINQKVNTPYGDALISMLALDQSGKEIYYCEMPTCGKWITRELLEDE